MPIKVLALDLERTLITNCINRHPRPGLFDFLEFCLNHFERVVIFTGVTSETAREVLEELESKGSIPKEFLIQVEILDWEGEYKDLRFIEGAESEEILIVDDYEDYILPEHKSQWIPIKPYDPPGINPWLPAENQGELDGDDDQELFLIRGLLTKKLSS